RKESLFRWLRNGVADLWRQSSHAETARQGIVRFRFFRDHYGQWRIPNHVHGLAALLFFTERCSGTSEHDVRRRRRRRVVGGKTRLYGDANQQPTPGQGRQELQERLHRG